MSELNVQQLLVNFGAWVRDDKNDLGCGNPYKAILAAAPNLNITGKLSDEEKSEIINNWLMDDDSDYEKPVQFKDASHMTDLDAAVVDTVLIRLAERHYHLYVLIMAHYVKQWSERKIARKKVMSRNQVGKDVCKAEGMLEGLLMRL